MKTFFYFFLCGADIGFATANPDGTGQCGNRDRTAETGDSDRILMRSSRMSFGTMEY